jgi:hypothetical protein
MRLQKFGHVVNISSSLLVSQPIAGLPGTLTSLTKAGLESVTRALAIEFATEGIRFNAIAPGVVNTPMHQPETHEFLRQLSPMKRLAEVGEVADLLLYLESADFVNGEVVHLDGGHMLASGNARKSWNSTRVAQQLGIDYPIIQAPFGGLPSQCLTATVSNLGGLGSLGAVTLGSSAISEVIAEIRGLTNKPSDEPAFRLTTTAPDLSRLQKAPIGMRRRCYAAVFVGLIK